MSASAEPLLKSFGKPLEHKSFARGEKGTEFLRNTAYLPLPSFVLVLVTTPSLSAWRQPEMGPQTRDECGTEHMRDRKAGFVTSTQPGQSRTQLGHWWLLTTSESP